MARATVVLWVPVDYRVIGPLPLHAFVARVSPVAVSSRIAGADMWRKG